MRERVACGLAALALVRAQLAKRLFHRARALEREDRAVGPAGFHDGLAVHQHLALRPFLHARHPRRAFGVVHAVRIQRGQPLLQWLAHGRGQRHAGQGVGRGVGRENVALGIGGDDAAVEVAQHGSQAFAFGALGALGNHQLQRVFDGRGNRVARVQQHAAQTPVVGRAHGHARTHDGRDAAGRKLFDQRVRMGLGLVGMQLHGQVVVAQKARDVVGNLTKEHQRDIALCGARGGQRRHDVEAADTHRDQRHVDAAAQIAGVGAGADDDFDALLRHRFFHQFDASVQIAALDQNPGAALELRRHGQRHVGKFIGTDDQHAGQVGAGRKGMEQVGHARW